MKSVISSIVFSLATVAANLAATAPAEAANCHVYEVNIQGTATVGDANFVSQTQQFSVTQYAMWRDTGVSTHQVEFVLTSLQGLNGSPQVGVIELMTNSAFARNAGIASAKSDLATVLMANVIGFEIDPAMSLQLPSPNVFVSPGPGVAALGGIDLLPGLRDIARQIGASPVLSASYFVPRRGGGFFHTPDGGWASIAGEINLAGSGLDNPSFQGQYQAQFAGNYVGSFQCD